jgi:hypothetical protein
MLLYHTVQCATLFSKVPLQNSGPSLDQGPGIKQSWTDLSFSSSMAGYQRYGTSWENLRKKGKMLSAQKGIKEYNKNSCRTAGVICCRGKYATSPSWDNLRRKVTLVGGQGSSACLWLLTRLYPSTRLWVSNCDDDHVTFTVQITWIVLVCTDREHSYLYLKKTLNLTI